MVMMGRRHVIGGTAAMAAAWTAMARAAEVDLNLPGGGGLRPLIKYYPQKGEMILQRTLASTATDQLNQPAGAADAGHGQWG